MEQEPVLTTAAEQAFFDENNDSDFEEEESESSDEEEKESETEAEVDEEASVSIPVAEQASSKMPAKKPAASKKVSSINELSKSVGKMKISKRFSMSFRCPWLLYDHVINGRDILTAEFLIPNVHRRWIKVKVDPCGTKLYLTIVVPTLFYEKSRVLAANVDDTEFNRNTSKATRFAAVCKEIAKTADDDDNVWEDPQVINLPFQVEEQLFTTTRDADDAWGVELYDNDDAVLVDEMGGHTDFFILRVDMLSAEKKVPVKSKGRMRRITAAPAPAPAPAPIPGGKKRNFFDEDDMGDY